MRVTTRRLASVHAFREEHPRSAKLHMTSLRKTISFISVTVTLCFYFLEYIIVRSKYKVNYYWEDDHSRLCNGYTPSGRLPCFFFYKKQIAQLKWPLRLSTPMKYSVFRKEHKKYFHSRIKASKLKPRRPYKHRRLVQLNAYLCICSAIYYVLTNRSSDLHEIVVVHWNAIF